MMVDRMMNERGNSLLEVILAGFIISTFLGFATFKVGELQKHFVMAKIRIELSHVMLQTERLLSWSGSSAEVKHFLVGELNKNIDLKTQCTGGASHVGNSTEHGLFFSCTIDVKNIGIYGVTKKSEVIQY